MARCSCSFCAGTSPGTQLFSDDPTAFADLGSSFVAGTGGGDGGVLEAAVVAAVAASVGGGSTAGSGVASGVMLSGGSTAAGSVPSWVSSLSDATIRSDMSSAISGSWSVTYSGLATLFSDVANLLKTGGSTLSSAQFADLKNVAANLNNGVSTSAYLTSVTNSLVNGSAANAKWTGGTSTPVALGNLAVGSNATQMSELVGKWFLGTDLPNATVSIGGPSFTVTYSIQKSPLYAASGPSMADINQGYLGDCYFLASLAEVAKQSPSAIQSMFVDNGNGTYGVRFFYNGMAQYVTVNSALAGGGSKFNKDPSALWASLAEKAYAQFQATYLETGNSVNYGNSWSTIGNGGDPIYALEAITGSSSLTDYIASGSSWRAYNYQSSLNYTGSTSGISNASLQSTLIADLNAGYDLVLCSWTNAYDSAGKQTLVSSHALSIYGFDNATGMFQIRNPWGTATGQYWNTTFEVSLSTLQSYGDYIAVAAPTTFVASSVLSIAATSASQYEGAAGSTTALTFTVTRTGNTVIASSATWAVSGSAVTGADFAGGALPTGTVNFAAGQTSQTITVNIAGDSAIEADEGFAVTLASPGANTTIGTASANGTILNDDSQFAIVAANASRAEGNSGSTPYTFTVNRSGYLGAAQTVKWAVAGTGANAATAADFVGGALPTGTLNFAAGQSSQTVTVNVVGDTTTEADETFAVTLSNASGQSSIGTASATGTILNDDVVSSISIAPNASAKLEGAAGATTPFTFTVTRTGNTTSAASATWTVAGTGANPVNGADFVGGVLPSGTVNFAAGQTSQTITVNVAGDNAIEMDEAFAVTLSSASAGTSIGTASASSIVLTDDSQFSVAAASAAKAEGNSGSTPFTFTVSRTGYLGAAQTVNWSVAGTGSSAASAADFVGGVLPSGTLNFAAGQTGATITVNVAGDTAVEANETFAVTLASPSGQGSLGTASATGTIQNDDSTAPSGGGFHVNLLWDSSVASAPSTFKTAVQTAANMLQAAFSDNITVNISVGWGEIGGSAITQSGVAEGGPSGGAWVSYAALKTALASHATSSVDQSVLAALAATQNPNNNGNIAVWSSQEKALGLIAANGTALDGEIGFSTDFPSYAWVGAALHEITHAMGRTSGYSPYGIEDLLRYSAPGVHQYAGGPAAYFSVDGGATKLANFATSSDYGDWASDSLTVNDPFNAFVSTNANSLTNADLVNMDAIGFSRVTGATVSATAGLVSSGMAFAGGASSATASGPISGGADTTFSFEDMLGGAGQIVADGIGAAPMGPIDVSPMGGFASIDPSWLQGAVSPGSLFGTRAMVG